MPKLKARLINLPSEAVPQRGQFESEYLRHLHAQFGGEAGALASYEHWLARHGEKGADVETLRKVFQWESAHARATGMALERCPGDSALAFFVVQID